MVANRYRHGPGLLHPFSLAVANGALDVAEMILRGSKHAPPPGELQTALWWVVIQANTEAIELLIRHGVRPDARDPRTARSVRFRLTDDHTRRSIVNRSDG